MSVFQDLTGQTFGEWKVMYRVENAPNGEAVWHCICSCGQERNVCGGSLRCGRSKTCGHFRIKGNPKHGRRYTKLYAVWDGMRSRCNTPTNKAYHYYGGRGIKICKEWDDFSKFEKWAVQNGYREGLSIDRINNDGNYEPSNCRWATAHEQRINQRPREKRSEHNV